MTYDQVIETMALPVDWMSSRIVWELTRGCGHRERIDKGVLIDRIGALGMALGRLAEALNQGGLDGTDSDDQA